MITCLLISGNKWKQRASSALHGFSELVYKIIMNIITKAMGKSYELLFSYINIST